ncbi:hypothetical protein B296_00031895, partial [Ensete ventricosum]
SPRMASELCSLVLGRGLSCTKPRAHPPIARLLRPSLRVSGKMRNRNLRSALPAYFSAHYVRIIVSVGLLVAVKIRQVADLSLEFVCFDLIYRIENDVRQELSSIRLEDLISMIRNAEKNARIKVAAQEKINVELLEGQLEKLKNEMSSRNSVEEGKHSILDWESPVILELNDLRKENELLKDDIQTLKLKLADISETEEHVSLLGKEQSALKSSFMELQSQFAKAQDDVSKLDSLQYECKALSIKVENLQELFDNARQKLDHPSLDLQHHELQKKVDKLEASVTETNMSKFPSEKFHHYDEILQQKIDILEKRLQESDVEIHSQIEMFQESVREFHHTLSKLKEENEKKSQESSLENMPWEFWSQLLLIIDGWLLEKKISANDAKLLREMIWKKDAQIHDAFLASRSKNEHEKVATFLKLTPGLHIIHIAAEMAPVAKGIAPASELASCGLNVVNLNRPDRMQDNSAHDKVNPVKGGRGLHETLKSSSKKFVGVLNGIDTDAWNPSTDNYIRVQYSVDDLQGKAGNKDALRKLLKLSSSKVTQPLVAFPYCVYLKFHEQVGCITRLVPQKGVHLIRHAIYRTLELGGQFVLLGSSPVPHIQITFILQREFEDIANQFQSHSHVRLLLKYDDALSHLIFAASDMFVIPSMFEPCGLTQVWSLCYFLSIVIHLDLFYGFHIQKLLTYTISKAASCYYKDGAYMTVTTSSDYPFVIGLSNAMERAFQYYIRSPEMWLQLVQRDMRLDFSWNSSATQYEELYQRSVARARTTTRV